MTNSAQTIETSLKRIALGLLLLTLSFGISLISYFSDENMVGNLRLAQQGLSVLVVLIVLPAFYNMVKLRVSKKGQCQETDNYMAEVFRFAGAFSFSITFVALIALEVINRNIGQELPTSVYLQSVKFIAIGTFTSYFYIKLYSDKLDEIDDDFNDEDAS